MNPELMNFIALCLGWVAMITLFFCVIGCGYLCAYEIIRAAGNRIFLPVWIWHVVTTIACIRASRAKATRSAYVSYLFQVLMEHEEKYPELRGLLDLYAQQRVDSRHRDESATAKKEEEK